MILRAITVTGLEVVEITFNARRFRVKFIAKSQTYDFHKDFDLEVLSQTIAIRIGSEGARDAKGLEVLLGMMKAGGI